MQYILDNDIYKVVRTTGPKHNYLGLSFAATDEPIEVVELPLKESEDSIINVKDVLSQVQEGLSCINEELGTNYKVFKIEFVSSDTPSGTVYKFLTEEIVRRIENKGEFKVV